MSGWTTRVDEPFAGEPRFWRAVALATAALGTVVVAAAGSALIGGPVGLALFAVPAALLALSLTFARAASARTRVQFDNRVAWRDAERRAVASALRGLVDR
jgi:hypothetical protein